MNDGAELEVLEAREVGSPELVCVAVFTGSEDDWELVEAGVPSVGCVGVVVGLLVEVVVTG